jgi:hypothetical protein
MCRNFHWPAICVLVLVLANTSNGSAPLGSPSPTVRLEASILEGMHFSSAQSEVAFLGVL